MQKAETFAENTFDDEEKELVLTTLAFVGVTVIFNQAIVFPLESWEKATDDLEAFFEEGNEPLDAFAFLLNDETDNIAFGVSPGFLEHIEYEPPGEKTTEETLTTVLKENLSYHE